MSILAVPIGRPRWDKPFDRAGFLLISPIQGDRCRILVQPGSRDGIDPQGIKCDRTKHPVEIGGKQRVEDLSQPKTWSEVRVRPGWSMGSIPRSSSRAPTL